MYVLYSIQSTYSSRQFNLETFRQISMQPDLNCLRVTHCYHLASLVSRLKKWDGNFKASYAKKRDNDDENMHLRKVN